MRLGPYLEKLDQAVWMNRLLQLTLLAMSIVILVLARQSTIVHVVPPNLDRAYRVGPSSASREYLEQMATFLTVSALTVNPESAEYSARAFLRFLTPEARGRLEHVLLGDARFVKTNNLSQAFYPRVIDFFSPTKLRVTGTLMQWLAGKTVTQRDAAYTLTIEVRHYAPVLTDFSYVPPEGEGPPAGARGKRPADAPPGE